MATSEASRTAFETGERFVLHDIVWSFYKRLLRELNNRHVFVTHDRGSLERMSPSREHERYGHLLSRMILTLTEDLDIPVAGSGLTTFRRKDLDRGLEADRGRGDAVP